MDRDVYIPISRAAKLIGCSLGGIHYLVRKKKLIGRRVPLGKRLVLEILRDSIEVYRRTCRRKTPTLGMRFRERRRITTLNGYIEIYEPRHPRARCNGYVYEHTLVMERVLGRSLRPGEVVDHINSKRFDNRPENLKLCESQADHKRWEYVKPLVARGGNPETHKLCTGCDEIRQRSDFRKYSVYPDGLEFYCKACRSLKDLDQE